MFKRLALAWGLCLVAALFGSEALAQTTSVITGTVIDAATKKPVADVVVTATSPSLQGEQMVVTDASGHYRIPQLPPGIYTLRFEARASSPTRAPTSPCASTAPSASTWSCSRRPQARRSWSSAAPPTVDVGSSATGVNVDADFMRNIAVIRPGGKGAASRSFESLAELAPGANADRYGVSHQRQPPRRRTSTWSTACP